MYLGFTSLLVAKSDTKNMTFMSHAKRMTIQQTCEVKIQVSFTWQTYIG